MKQGENIPRKLPPHTNSSTCKHACTHTLTCNHTRGEEALELRLGILFMGEKSARVGCKEGRVSPSL